MLIKDRTSIRDSRVETLIGLSVGQTHYYIEYLKMSKGHGHLVCYGSVSPGTRYFVVYKRLVRCNQIL